MITVDYVDSDDPLIEIVQTDPGAIFAKPQMGYLFFLFGEADPDAADWIRGNLRALDSLLGPDIAGAVFVKSFETRALVRTYYTRDWNPPTRIRDGKVDLREINYVESSARATLMFDHRRDQSMEARQAFENLTATTYASDEVARSLGVLAELPCIVFLDAIPGPIRYLNLNAEHLPEALTLIRGIVGNLVADPQFDMFRRLLVAARAVGAEIGDLRQAAIDNDRLESETLKHHRQPVIRQLREAERFLLEGSARRFRHAVRQNSLPCDVIEDARARASGSAARLAHVCRTIRGVEWYVQMGWPICAADRGRLAALIGNHASAILTIDPPLVADLTETSVRDLMVSLQEVKAEIVDEIWGNLPTIADLERGHDVTKLRVREAAQEIRQRLAIQSDHLSAELERMVHDLAATPRITVAFDAIMVRRQSKATPMRDIGPEIAAQLLQALTSGAVKFEGRDIYIGTNVAAMGPFATAHDTNFESRPQI